jgi:catechol 2,3-dioxygenase-like lactoylglutathione lyase family enzyme
VALRGTGTRLLVKDYVRALRFYRDVLGFPITWGDETTGYVAFDAGGHPLAIFGRQDMADAIGQGDRLSEADCQDTFVLTFKVDDVDAEYERLRALGVEVVAAPVDRPSWGERTAHFRDPEGNLIEINHWLDG